MISKYERRLGDALTSLSSKLLFPEGREMWRLGLFTW